MSGEFLRPRQREPLVGDAALGEIGGRPAEQRRRSGDENAPDCGTRVIRVGARDGDSDAETGTRREAAGIKETIVGVQGLALARVVGPVDAAAAGNADG